MKLGLATYSYHYAAGLWEFLPRANPPMTALHFLRKASELGLDGVHFSDPRHLDSLEYGYVSGLREKAEALGLYVELGTEGTNPDHLQNMVRAAHVLGSPLVRTRLGKPRPRSAQGMSELLSATAAEVAQVVPVCDRYEVSLAIANGPDLTAREARELADTIGSPRVGVSLDTGETLALLEDALEAAHTVGPAVKSVHLKDFQVVATSEGFVLAGCALGEGVLDVAGVLDLLLSQAPETHCNIEAPMMKRAVPALSDDYLHHLPRATARDLGRVLRLVRDQGLAEMPRLAVERGASEDEVLAEEDEQVVRSVRWAARALGRPEAEAADSGA